MVPPTGPLNLDVEAISGICGSISIACWVVVFSPQIIENFRRASADGLSLQFIIVWLAGDVFNILGAVLQGLLPTMIILAVYYTIADIVLLGQCFYYRGFTWRDEVVPPPKPKKRKTRRRTRAAAANGNGAPDERTALLSKNRDSGDGYAESERHGHSSSSHHHNHHHHHHGHHDHGERRGSNWSALSPAVPFVPDLASPLDEPTLATAHHRHHHHDDAAGASPPVPHRPPSSTLQTVTFNALAIFMVCAAGVAGWYLSGGSDREGNHNNPAPGDGSSGGGSGGDDGDAIPFSFWGQVFGYLCALLYLGSRLPQLLLNWRRQSTDGVSMLFFLFACLGNLTYVLSILAYDGCAADAGGTECAPGEARARYGRYLLVNLSWLAGSLGTLLLDMGIFVQFFLYRVEGAETDSECDSDDDVEDLGETTDDATTAVENDESEEDEDEVRDERPLLRRNMSSYQYTRED